MRLTRYDSNPILPPNESSKWEALVTTNPGAWYDAEAGEVKLLYRAAGKDTDHVIRFGLATCPLQGLVAYLLECPVE